MSAETPHSIRWEFDDGGVTATAVCHAPPGADCRLTSVSCECERWGEIRRDEIGTPWHKIVDWYGGPIDSAEPQWHELKPTDDCNVCLFINESGCVEELGAGTFVIAETPIRPLWVDDGCEWERVPVAPTEETRTEWGVRRTWGAVGTVADFERDRRTAEKCAKEWPGELVSRTVTVSEWAGR